MLKPRLARTCLKHFLDPSKPLGTNFGGIIGLQAIGGVEIVRALIVPNLKEYGSMMSEVLDDENRKVEGDMVAGALVEALLSLEADTVGAVNGMANGHAGEMKNAIAEKVGNLFAEKVMETGNPKLVKAILEC
jgi:transcription initiation factor TFIID subunit 6